MPESEQMWPLKKLSSVRKFLDGEDLQHVGRGELRAADVAVPERAPVDALELADVDRSVAGKGRHGERSG